MKPLAVWTCPQCRHDNATRTPRKGCAGCDWSPVKGERAPPYHGRVPQVRVSLTTDASGLIAELDRLGSVFGGFTRPLPDPVKEAQR